MHSNTPDNARMRIGADRFPIWRDFIPEAQMTDFTRQITEKKPYPLRALVSLGMNHRMLPDQVGYIQITNFERVTYDQFTQAYNDLNQQQMKGLIIDLRNNPGGVLEAAVDVAEPFFKKGELIVYTQGRAPADRIEYRSRAEPDEKPITVPVAILVNQNSASAAEVVAGALKDTGRAVIVGERSFGKGSVQSVYNLDNGDGLRLTTARYHTPGGETIHERGVSPQVEVVLTPDEDDNIAAQLARPELVADSAAFKERFDAAPVPDRQLQAAVNALQGVAVFERWEERSKN